MYIPGISTPRGSTLVEHAKRLEKRKGGGGGGRGGGGGGASRGGSTSSGGSGAKSASSGNKPPAYSPGAPPPPYSVAGGAAVRGSPGAAGGGRPYTVAPGNSFAGAQAGGGTRGQVYSGRGYGSYGFLPFFPFMFWPIYFGGYPNYYGSGIYGPANNDTRPGGFLQAFTILSPTSAPNTTTTPTPGTAPIANNGFAIYGDNSTVADMVSILGTNCSVYPAYGQNYTVTPFNVVQYYRGSSFSLHLDGYNNSLPYIEGQSGENYTIPDTQPAALPAGVNADYLNCINTTIGSYVGLLDSDYATNGASRSTYSGGLVGSAALLIMAWHTLF